MKRKTTDCFISDARTVHGDTYDYSAVVYTNTHNPVTITCVQHGKFDQRPNRHLQGDGCPACGVHKTRSARIRDVESIVSQATSVHDGKYVYTTLLADGYHGTGDIPIECPVHGMFIQRLSDHLHKRAGCPSCANGVRGVWRVKSLEEFITEADAGFDGKYDYSKSVYLNGHTKLVVTCPAHGDFYVTPVNHVHNKSGCPRCNDSKGEQAIKALLERLRITFIQQHAFEGLVSHKSLNDRSLLHFDFFIPDQNTAIEYDGYFHYHLLPEGICSDYQRAWTAFFDAQARDTSKNQFCVNNNIRLIRVPYFVKNPACKLEKVLSSTQCDGIITIT